MADVELGCGVTPKKPDPLVSNPLTRTTVQEVVKMATVL